MGAGYLSGWKPFGFMNRGTSSWRNAFLGKLFFYEESSIHWNHIVQNKDDDLFKKETFEESRARMDKINGDGELFYSIVKKEIYPIADRIVAFNIRANPHLGEPPAINLKDVPSILDENRKKREASN